MSSSGMLSGAWWEERPRGVVADGLMKAASELYTGVEAPPGMEHYQNDPVGFMVQELGIRRETLVWSENPGYENHQWDGTPEPMVTWLEALANWENVAVESATGTGKSFTLALTKFWFLACWQGARCFDFAHKKEQLRDYSWVEIRKLWPRFKVLFPSADIIGLQIRMDGRVQEGETAGWGAVGKGVKVGADDEVATGAAGMHAPHMLISHEETQGIEHAVLRATENTCTSPHNLRQFVGNPDSQDDALHQAALAGDVRAIRMSAYDHPNVVVNVHRDPEWKDFENDELVVPGAVSRLSIVRRARRYRRGSDLYNSRVRGISPPQHKDALIRQEWLDRAADRWREGTLREGLPALASDVARSEDGDWATIGFGVGAHLDQVEKFRCTNTAGLGLRFAAILRMNDVAEQHAVVDVGGGLGGGTVDKLKELGHYVHAYNGGGKAHPEIDETLLDEEEVAIRHEVIFRNRRASDWWRFAMDLQLDRLALPPDPELHEDLRSVRWESKLGKIVIEEKADIADRLGRSPDKGDTAVMWNAVRNRRHDEELEPLRAWDPTVLEHEMKEGRRVRSKPAVEKGGIPAHLLERVD